LSYTKIGKILNSPESDVSGVLMLHENKMVHENKMLHGKGPVTPVKRTQTGIKLEEHNYKTIIGLAVTSNRIEQV
jgi:hypothetical protein